jgi:hypothetical protein
VDPASEKLLTSARFPHEQNGDTAARCDLGREGDDFADGGTLSNYVRIPPLLRGLLRSGCNSYTVPLSREQKAPARGIVIERTSPRTPGVGLT